MKKKKNYYFQLKDLLLSLAPPKVGKWMVLTLSHTSLGSEIRFTQIVHDRLSMLQNSPGKNSLLNDTSHHFKIFTTDVPGRGPRIVYLCTHISFFL